MAARDTDPRKRLAHWKAAAERNPRNPAYWKALAECYLADHNYSEAAKAWTRRREQAATDPAERERMHQARIAIEQQRLDYEDGREAAQGGGRRARDRKTQAAGAAPHVHASSKSNYNEAPPKRRRVSRCPGGTAPSPPAK